MSKKILFVLLIICLFITSIYSKDEDKIKDLLSKGYNLFLKNKDKQALKYIDQVLIEDPENIIGLFLKANILFQLKKYDESLTIADSLINIIENEEVDEEKRKSNLNFLSEAYRLKGVIFDIKGEYEKGLMFFKKAIELEPNIAKFYHDAAIALEYLNRKQEAYEYLEKAIDIDPFNLIYYEYLFQLYKNLKKTDNVNIQMEKASLLYSYGKLMDSKITENLYNLSKSEYDLIEGNEGYYEVMLTNNGTLLLDNIGFYIKPGDIIDYTHIADEHSEFMGNYMMKRTMEGKTDKKVKILGLKIKTFYESSGVKTLHFVYYVKYEVIE